MRFALFCKTFRDDLERFVVLLDSVERYSDSQLTFVVSVPNADRQMFLDRVGAGRFELVTDEEILGARITQSWRTQQLVKLHAWRMNFADAWLLVDSDAYFIRPFSIDNFVDSTGRVAFVADPFVHALWRSRERIHASLKTGDLSATSLVCNGIQRYQIQDLPTIPWYQTALDAIGRPSHDQRLARIQPFFRRPGPQMYYMPAPIWTLESLREMQTKLLEPRGLTFEKLVQHSPWEGVWVGEWEVFRGMPGRYLSPTSLLHIEV